MSFEEVKMTNAPQVGERPFFLEGRDFAWWLSSAAITGGVALTAWKLGLVDTYAEAVESLSHLDEVADKLSQLDVQGLKEKPLLLKQAAMGAGIVVAGLEQLSLTIDVLARLLIPDRDPVTGQFKPKARLIGNHAAIVTDSGVRETITSCGDMRIDENFQNQVELGAGTTGGWFVLFQTAAQGVQAFGGEGAAVDFFTGYFMGRTALSAGYSFLHTLSTAAFQGFGRSVFGGEGPARDIHSAHNGGCGMTATISPILHWLKFSGQDKPSHKAKIKLMDALNFPAQLVSDVIWEPFLNTVAYLASLGTYSVKFHLGIQDLIKKPT